ncbi:MAG: hypothetical protein LWW93_02485 [Hyphomicrobiales bacterium]|nr:hypothetical protein [Hyphomicrobiales bacterium]
MLYGLLALALFLAAGYLFFSAMDRPLKPIPPGTDPVYLIIPAMLVSFGAVVAAAFAMGASVQDVKDAIADVITNMFAII